MCPLKAMSNEPEKVRALLNRFVEGTQSAPAYARNEFHYGIAKDLLNNNRLLDDAVELARKAVALLNEQEYVANERRVHEQKEVF